MWMLASLKAWQAVVLAAVVLIGFGGAFGVYAYLSRGGDASLDAGQQLIPVQRGDLVNEVSVNGSVLFPNRETLTFGSQGTVAEIFVEEGQRVDQSEPLATFDPDTIAGLEKAVAQARVDFRNAQEALAESSRPATELEIARAESKIADAAIVLDTAVAALELLKDPTGLATSQARAKVASSKASLLNAQEAMANLTDPPSGQAIASAKAKIASSRQAVQNAEDALARLLEPPTALEIAQAEAKITDARLALERAEEALADIKAGATPDQIADARLTVETAQTQLANAEAELAFNVSDWNGRLDDAREEVRNATDDYLAEFEKWLGMRPATEELDGDPDVVLASVGIDLDSLFDPAQRYTGLSSVDAAMGLPADDPATPWNEATLFTWQNLSPATIVATCDGAGPALGFCVQQELRTSGASYEKSLTSLDSLRVQSAKALAASESSVDKARDALAASQDALAELEEPPDPLAVEDRGRDLAVASSTLQMALDDLASLRQEPSDVEVENQVAQIELARESLEQAKADLADLMEPPDDVLLENQRQQVELAASNLAQAEDDLADLLDGADDALLEARRLDVEVARLNLADLKADLAELRLGPDPLDLALWQANVVSANAALEQAEDRLANAVIVAPWAGFISVINVEVGESVNPNAPVMQIVDPTVVEVDGIVDEIDVLSVRVGSTAVVSMDALPGELLAGSVSYIATEARTQQGVVSYPIRIRVASPEGLELPEGLSAVASVVIREDQDVLMVPIQSLYGSFDEPSVKLMENGSVVDRKVVLGNNDGFWTVVVDGLSEGETVIMESKETQGDRFQFRGGDFRRLQTGIVGVAGPGISGGGGRGRR